MDGQQLSASAHTEAGAVPVPQRAASVAADDAKSASSSGPMELLRKMFSFPAMLGSLIVGAVFMSGMLFKVDPDLWWHIKVGGDILKTHHWPTTDPFSFTVFGQPWLAYEWIGDVLFAMASRLGGLRGLDAMLIIVGSMVCLSLYALATLRSGKSKAGFVAATLLFLLAVPSFSLRPQMLGYLFLVLTVLVLERFRQGRHGTIWLLPVLMLVWENSHGSWIIGMGTIFVYWMSGLFEFRLGNVEARRWSAAERKIISFVFLLCVAVLPITPYGTQVAISPFEFAFKLPLNVQHILEWQSMPFSLPGGKLFLLLLLGFFVLQMVMDFTWRVEELALFLFGTVMACLHVRFLLIFVPFAAPLFGVVAARWTDVYHRSKDKFALNAIMMAGVAAAIFFFFPTKAELQEKVALDFPVVAVDYLNANPQAAPEPMYNTYGFGGYLVWARGPEHKVFVDGRGDVYERGGLFADYIHIADVRPEALTLLDHYGIQSCLVQRDEALATLLSASPRWKRTYVDTVSALYVRAGAAAAIPPATTR
jgi:hypothetical protein